MHNQVIMSSVTIFARLDNLDNINYFLIIEDDNMLDLTT